MLFERIEAGERVDLRTGDPSADDPANAAAWEEHRTIEAAALIGPLTSPGPPIRIRGARVTGELDLEARELQRPLHLQDCHFQQAINLAEASAPSIRLPGCHLPGLSAPQLRTTGNLGLDHGFLARGEIDLVGAHIGGRLTLSGATISNPGGHALNADRLTADQGIFCRSGFAAEGETRLLGARIGGTFELDGAHLSNPGGDALQADWLTVERFMQCTDGFTADGRVSLASARIAHLDLTGARLTHPGGQALNGHGMIIEQDITCRALVTEGEVVLQRARIGGNVHVHDARLHNPGGRALHADGLTVELSFLGRNGFTADGEVRLLGAAIGGVLDLIGARVSNPGGRALYAIRLDIGGDLLYRDGTAEGKVQLSGARIGGQLDLDRALLDNPGGQAVQAWQLRIGEHLFCRYGFRANGTVSLVRANVNGSILFEDAVLSNPGGLALNLEATTAQAISIRFRGTPDGGVDLSHAQTRTFSDSPESWPEGAIVRGFTYTAFENDDASARDRLRWLARQPETYFPQPYDQLAAAYRNDGREEAARKVMIAKQRRRRKAFSPLGRTVNWILYLTVGYGYRTWLSAAWLAAFLAAGTLLFADSTMTRTDSKGPPFHAFAYALDVLLPIVDLGQQKAWHPHGVAQYVAWILIGAGWLLTTAVVAGLTVLIKRD